MRAPTSRVRRKEKPETHKWGQRAFRCPHLCVSYASGFVRPDSRPGASAMPAQTADG
ncbi:hypothetical protein HMPREF0972_02325 [Actinomyces sp. oral taxon 848 str. F0332]|nr:hypothetical protein HMPREF0972_02325 [Actinomyces sp. oral taxon 848 str. F0332]